MTRAHVTFRRAREFKKYVVRADAKIIGGSLSARTFADLDDQLTKLAGDDKIAHLTISLHAGLTTSNRTFRRIVATELKNRGLDYLAIPWVAVRHYDGACHHVHVAVAQQTWAGRKVPFPTSEALSDRCEDLLREALGLPTYPRFDQKG